MTTDPSERLARLREEGRSRPVGSRWWAEADAQFLLDVAEAALACFDEDGTMPLDTPIQTRMSGTILSIATLPAQRLFDRLYGRESGDEG